MSFKNINLYHVITFTLKYIIVSYKNTPRSSTYQTFRDVKKKFSAARIRYKAVVDFLRPASRKILNVWELINPVI